MYVFYFEAMESFIWYNNFKKVQNMKKREVMKTDNYGKKPLLWVIGCSVNGRASGIKGSTQLAVVGPVC